MGLRFEGLQHSPDGNSFQCNIGQEKKTPNILGIEPIGKRVKGWSLGGDNMDAAAPLMA